MIGCSSNEGLGQNPSCREFNEAAVDSLTEYNLGRRDSLLLLNALDLLNRAIDCDSMYQLAYLNKLTVLTMLGKQREVLILIERLERVLPQDPGIFIAKGLQYEKIGKKDSAEVWYDRAKQRCDQNLDAYPDSANFIYDRVMLIAITAGKEQALSEIDKYISRYPEKEELSSYRQGILNFDKERYLNR